MDQRERGEPIKAYVVHDGEPSERACLVFAWTAEQAISLGERGSDFDYGMEVYEISEDDIPEGFEPSGDPRLVEDDRTYRAYGWMVEGERRCDKCGLCPFPGVPKSVVCDECYQCAECGCDCEREG